MTMSKEHLYRLFGAFLCAASAVIPLAGCEGPASLLPTSISEKVEIAALSDASSSHLLDYPMPAVDGGFTRANTLVFIPTGEVPQGGWPMILWGHEVVGVADVCAPSRSPNLHGSADYVNAWLAAGYAVVAPDFEGLGTPAAHPFSHLGSGANSMGYAALAALERFPDQLSKQLVTVGQAQGGQAALGLAQRLTEFPQLDVLGVVAIAPASQFAQQNQFWLETSEDITLQPDVRIRAAVSRMNYAAFLLEGVAAIDPTFDPSVAYGEYGAGVRNAVVEGCNQDVFQVLVDELPGVLLVNESSDSIINSALGGDPRVVEFLAAAEPGQLPIDVPVLLLQGVDDEFALADNARALADELTALATDGGAVPQLRFYDNHNHFTVRAASFNDALGFVAGLYAEE